MIPSIQHNDTVIEDAQSDSNQSLNLPIANSDREAGGRTQPGAWMRLFPKQQQQQNPLTS